MAVWSVAVDVCSSRLSTKNTFPPGSSADCTVAQKPSKRPAGTCDSQKAKNTASTRARGDHEKRSATVSDVIGTHPVLVDRNDFR